MKVKLVQAGGFVGKKKSAEEDLSNFDQSVQQKVLKLFSQPVLRAGPGSLSRDKENLFLEMNGKSISLDNFDLDDDVTKMVEKLKSGLQY